MNRVEILSSIIDRHIECLDYKTEPSLTDTKTLTEILKAILVLEQIKNLDGKKSSFDDLTEEELSARIESIGE